jgi:hypothetical protein
MHILLGILYAEFGIIDFARSSNSTGNAKDGADGGKNFMLIKVELTRTQDSTLRENN